MKKRIGKRLSEILLQDLACVSNSYDIVGDIAIVRPTKKHLKLSDEVGRAIMAAHKNVKTVLTQTNAVDSEFRLRELKHVLGEKRVQTVHRESGCLFRVDLANISRARSEV